jgi:hypothetical protein
MSTNHSRILSITSPWTKKVSTYKPPQITVSPRKYGSKPSTVPNIKIVGRHQDVLWTPSKTGPQGLTHCHPNRHVPMLIGRIPLSVVNPHDWWSNPEHVWTSQVSDFDPRTKPSVFILEILDVLHQSWVKTPSCPRDVLENQLPLALHGLQAAIKGHPIGFSQQQLDEFSRGGDPRHSFHAGYDPTGES